MPQTSSVDDLYKLPLGEFTAARNALAKQPGASVEIKTLHKPTLPAWAVNQLYWRRRKAYDRVVNAAEKLRDAHGRMLGGKNVDLAAAEAAHNDAIKSAVDDVRGLLRDAGETDTQATMTAVTETLRALPSDEPPGRLTRPLKPKGFEALKGLFGSVSKFPDVRPQAPTTATKNREVDRREAEKRRREAEELADELRVAKAAERQTASMLERTRRAHADAVEEEKELTARLEALSDRVRKLADDVRKQERELAKATTDRERLELRLDAVKS